MKTSGHMCRIDHEEIHYYSSGDDERCPLCKANDDISSLTKERDYWKTMGEQEEKKRMDADSALADALERCALFDRMERERDEARASAGLYEADLRAVEKNYSAHLLRAQTDLNALKEKARAVVCDACNWLLTIHPKEQFEREELERVIDALRALVEEGDGRAT